MASQVSSSADRGNKRPKTDESNTEPSEKRSRLSGKAYMFNELFLGGKDSDIVIKAFDKEWNLHKIILKQSGYFNSMFDGGWNEKEEKSITINPPDPNISLESLNTVFGALYKDECDDLKVENCLSILATASFLQLGSIIDKCNRFLEDNINVDVAVEFYTGVDTYGLDPSLKEKFVGELRKGISVFAYSPDFGKKISLALLEEMLNEPQEVFVSDYAFWAFIYNWTRYQTPKFTSDSFSKDPALVNIWKKVRLWNIWGTKAHRPFEAFFPPNVVQEVLKILWHNHVDYPAQHTALTELSVDDFYRKACNNHYTFKAREDKRMYLRRRNNSYEPDWNMVLTYFPSPRLLVLERPGKLNQLRNEGSTAPNFYYRIQILKYDKAEKRSLDFYSMEPQLINVPFDKKVALHTIPDEFEGEFEVKISWLTTPISDKDETAIEFAWDTCGIKAVQ